MKVDTVEQYKVLEFIKSNFYIDTLKVTLIDRYTIQIEDTNGDKLNFYYENGKVKY